MAEWTFSSSRKDTSLLVLIRGTRYFSIEAGFVDYGNGFKLVLQSDAGKFIFWFYRRNSPEKEPYEIIKDLLKQREILFRKFEL